MLRKLSTSCQRTLGLTSQLVLLQLEASLGLLRLLKLTIIDGSCYLGVQGRSIDLEVSESDHAGTIHMTTKTLWFLIEVHLIRSIFLVLESGPDSVYNQCVVLRDLSLIHI